MNTYSIGAACAAFTLVACAHGHRTAPQAENARESRMQASAAQYRAEAERPNPEANDTLAVGSDGSAATDDMSGVEMPKRRAQPDRFASTGETLPVGGRSADSNGAGASANADNGGAGARNSADNTGVNTRDRSEAALTPMDQGSGAVDMDLTQRIRKAVLADASLSFEAKNVKIITQNGHVTLRGAVNTSREKDVIGKAANRAAGMDHVTNQLEVAQ